MQMPPGAAMMGMPMDQKSFFGGSFFTQTDSNSECRAQAAAKLQQFLPKVNDTMSDDEILTQLAELGGIDEKDMLAQLENETGFDKDAIVQQMREFASQLRNHSSKKDE